MDSSKIIENIKLYAASTILLLAGAMFISSLLI